MAAKNVVSRRMVRRPPAETRAAIGDGGVLSPEVRLHFKHIDGAFGFIEEADLWAGVLRLVDKKTGALGRTYAPVVQAAGPLCAVHQLDHRGAGDHIVS